MKQRILRLLLAVAAVAWAQGHACSAGTELRPGTIVEFASAEAGRQILAERETGFIQAMSQFDRCVRMKTSRAVTEAEFVSYVTNQVRAWTPGEQTKVTTALLQIRDQIRNLNLTLPRQFFLVKTTGNEEGNAAYLRGADIILPQVMISGDATQFRKILTHELFHVYLYHNPQLRGAFYNLIGVQRCPEIALPEWLVERRITSPNPEPWAFVIRPLVNGVRTPCLPVFYAKATNYTGGQLFDYLVTRLLVLENAGEGYRACLLPSGVPQLVDPTTGQEVGDYYSQIGLNTTYNIHPEETLADNFVLAVGTNYVQNSPRVPYMLRQVINNPAAAVDRLPAGRFWASLDLDPGRGQVIETSTNLKDWTVWDYVPHAPSKTELIDTEAWLQSRRFYRARVAELEPLDPGDTNNLVWIPPGTFLMGSPPGEVGRSSDEGPQTLVTLTRGFWIGKYEVTQEEYATVMGANPSFFQGLPLLPVEQVNWLEATDYCARLTAREQTAGRLPAGWQFRLPTEAEWEYATRAGTTGRYSFGDDPDSVEIYRQACFMDSGYVERRPRLVTARPPNPWGLYGLYGNVGEWCADWYARYAGGSVTDPQGPAAGTNRVYRGAGYFLRARDCRCASRKYANPNDRQGHVGFRVVLAPGGP